jgi:hypothetical protein
VYAVLGNHDTIRMVPGFEEMGIRMLLNECEPILRGGKSVYKNCALPNPKMSVTTDQSNVL